MNEATALADLPISPVYPRRDRDAPQPWRARRDWAVSQRIDHPEPARANALALLDLEGGADALTLVASASLASRGGGLAAPADVATALAGVELDLIGLRLDAGADAPAFAEALAALVEARRLGSAGLALDFGFDPVALQACGCTTDPEAPAELVRLAQRAGLHGRPLLCDARPWHEAGAGEARELALVLATAVALFRRLEAAGSTLDAARRAVAVLLPFDADVLLGPAKGRAARRLWARLEVACGLEPAPLLLHAETSWRMMTRADPHTNAMRATAAVYAAGLGGADGVTVLPMSLVSEVPDAAARRLARNTGRVLLDEADLAACIDPAAGSGALESLTEDLCARAWTLFQDIERNGGIEAGLRDGSVRRGVEADARRRRRAIEALEHGIVGTSLYPSLDDVAVSRRDMDGGATGGEPLDSRRDAEPFERLRALAERDGTRPEIFLATLGAPAAFGSRASLAANLFAAVGIAAATPPSVPRDVSAQVAAFRGSGTPVACLCGADAAYAAEGPSLVAALVASGATVLVLDGKVEGATTLMASGDTTLPTLRATLEHLERS